MYYILYAFLYLLSLLPFGVLYVISDVAFFFIFYVFGYRKEIVFKNLSIAFPEKSDDEKRKIMKKFYRNLTDSFIETIKLLSMSSKQFDARVKIDITQVNELTKKGYSIQVHSGHQMNWEYAHLVFAKYSPGPWLGVYMPIKNKAVDKLYLKIRTRYHAIMLSASTFKTDIRHYYHKPYLLALIADQNPGIPKNGQWLQFFNRPAPFNAGPEKGAIRNKTAVVFVNFVKLSRGKYLYEPVLITENAGTMQNGELTRLYRDFLEENIRKQPDNYLWSHRRWKIPYDPAFEKRWIDSTPPPSV